MIKTLWSYIFTSADKYFPSRFKKAIKGYWKASKHCQLASVPNYFVQKLKKTEEGLPRLNEIKIYQGDVEEFDANEYTVHSTPVQIDPFE